MFKKADEEFQKIAEELYAKHYKALDLEVKPSSVMFLRNDKAKPKKGQVKFAYCKVIRGEYAFLTDKKFFIVIMSTAFDELKTDKEKRYVILHEMKHLGYKENENTGKETYCLYKHNLENFTEMIINPNWNTEMV